jgi:hypothetical protein
MTTDRDREATEQTKAWKQSQAAWWTVCSGTKRKSWQRRKSIWDDADDVQWTRWERQRRSCCTPVSNDDDECSFVIHDDAGLLAINVPGQLVSRQRSRIGKRRLSRQ